MSLKARGDFSHNNRMQSDFGKRYALTSAADAKRQEVMLKTVTPYLAAIFLVGLSIVLSATIWFIFGGYNSAGLLNAESQAAIENEANLVLIKSLLLGILCWVIAFFVMRIKPIKPTNKFLPVVVSTICALSIVYAGLEAREYVLKSKYYPKDISEHQLPNNRMQSDLKTAAPFFGA